MSEQHFNALPAGYQLQEYTLKSVLGHGGFGITYLAADNNLGKDVAIKEYLPTEFAVRRDDSQVQPRSTADNNDYEWGLDRFMKEAQTLGLFRHPNIVPVYRAFKANGTAYMVMEYQNGQSLVAWSSFCIRRRATCPHRPRW
jgi:serine/threonine protein kinase